MESWQVVSKRIMGLFLHVTYLEQFKQLALQVPH